MIFNDCLCPENFKESLRIETLAITVENGLNEYSVTIQGEDLERIAQENNILYKTISGMGGGNIIATALHVDGLTERAHEAGINAAATLLAAYLTE